MSDIYEKIKSSGNEFEQILREYNKERERKTQLIEGRQRRIDDIINTIMSDDYHYGTIPIGYDLTANDLQCIDVPLNLIITPQIVEYYDIGEFYTLEEFLELLALPDDYPIEIPSFMNLHSLFSLLQET